METILGRLVHSLTNQRTQLALATMVVPLGLLCFRPLQIWMPGLHLKVRWHRKVSVSGPSFGVIASHQEVAEMDGLLCRREAV